MSGSLKTVLVEGAAGCETKFATFLLLTHKSWNSSLFLIFKKKGFILTYSSGGLVPPVMAGNTWQHAGRAVGQERKLTGHSMSTL